MGKCSRKAAAKVTADVAVMELGVRTRAKTLALRSTPPAAAVAPPPEASYLQLRSRRLEKRNPPAVRRGCGCGGEELVLGGARVSSSIEGEDLGIQFDFGDGESKRSTRESTPCNLIKTPDTITTPSSATKKPCSFALNQRPRNELLLANVPSAREIEDFFAREEQLMQRHFAEKYNFDFVKDIPLPGRYEWVAMIR